MKKLTYCYITISILLLVGCSSTQTGSVIRTDKGAEWNVKGKGIVETEFYPDGTLRKVKYDNKAEPLIKLNNLSPKYETD